MNIISDVIYYWNNLSHSQKETGPNTNQSQHKDWKLKCTRNLLIIPLQ